MYGSNGNRLVAGDRLVMADLARTLERLAEHGADDLYRGELARALSEPRARAAAARSRCATCAEYRVIQRRPVRVQFLGHEFELQPAAVDRRRPDRARAAAVRPARSWPAGPGSAEAMAQLVEIMREQEAARGGPFTRELYRGGLARRLSDEASWRRRPARIRGRLPELQQGTTHIAVVDGHGNAASLTASTGAGSGVIVPGTGIQLNNMLGEFDLAVTGGHPRPGVRFTSAMAPSLVLARGPPAARGRQRRLAAPARRDHADRRQRRRARPRRARRRSSGRASTLEAPSSTSRAGTTRPSSTGSSRSATSSRAGASRNLFFGGAAGVELLEDGTLAAAGDSRRGGHGVVVA